MDGRVQRSVNAGLDEESHGKGVDNHGNPKVLARIGQRTKLRV